MSSESEKDARIIKLLTEEDAFELLRMNQSLRTEVLERKKMEKRLRKYQKELRLLTSELALAEERRRRSIAYELHERLGQTLAISKIKTSALIQKAPDADFEKELREVYKIIDEAITDTRLLTRELSPPVLHQFGLTAAIECLAEELRARYGIDITVELAEIERLDIDIEVKLFQITRELLINVVNHSVAAWCKVSLAENSRSLRIIIQDNGRGFAYNPGNGKKNGFSLFGIKEMIKHLGGCFHIKSNKGSGSVITLIIPKTQLRKKPAK